MTGEQLLKELEFIAQDANAVNSSLARRLNRFYTKLSILLTEEEIINVA